MMAAQARLIQKGPKRFAATTVCAAWLFQIEDLKREVCEGKNNSLPFFFKGKIGDKDHKKHTIMAAHRPTLISSHPFFE